MRRFRTNEKLRNGINLVMVTGWSSVSEQKTFKRGKFDLVLCETHKIKQI